MKLSATTGMEFERLRDEVMRAEKRVVSLSGLTSVAAKAFFLSRLQAETGKSLVIVTDSNQEMEMWTSDLEFFRSRISNFESEISNLKSKFEISNLRSKILALPSFETEVYSGISPHAETQERRALTLWSLANEKPDFLVLP